MEEGRRCSVVRTRGVGGWGGGFIHRFVCEEKGEEVRGLGESVGRRGIERDGAGRVRREPAKGSAIEDQRQ